MPDYIYRRWEINYLEKSKEFEQVIFFRTAEDNLLEKIKNAINNSLENIKNTFQPLPNDTIPFSPKNGLGIILKFKIIDNQSGANSSALIKIFSTIGELQKTKPKLFPLVGINLSANNITCQDIGSLAEHISKNSPPLIWPNIYLDLSNNKINAPGIYYLAELILANKIIIKGINFNNNKIGEYLNIKTALDAVSENILKLKKHLGYFYFSDANNHYCLEQAKHQIYLEETQALKQNLEDMRSDDSFEAILKKETQKKTGDYFFTNLSDFTNPLKKFKFKKSETKTPPAAFDVHCFFKSLTIEIEETLSNTDFESDFDPDLTNLEKNN